MILNQHLLILLNIVFKITSCTFQGSVTTISRRGRHSQFSSIKFLQDVLYQNYGIKNSKFFTVIKKRDVFETYGYYIHYCRIFVHLYLLNLATQNQLIFSILPNLRAAKLQEFYGIVLCVWAAEIPLMNPQNVATIITDKCCWCHFYYDVFLYFQQRYYFKSFMSSVSQ